MATGAAAVNPPPQPLGHLDVDWPFPIFDILNLIPRVASPSNVHTKEWKAVGNITRQNQTLNAIKYIGGPFSNADNLGPDSVGNGATKHHFRVVTGMAPPFVQASTKLENSTCLTGNACLRVNNAVALSLYLFLLFVTLDL